MTLDRLAWFIGEVARPYCLIVTGSATAWTMFDGKDAAIIGKTITDSGLWEKDITVLTLHRGAHVVPNPRASTILEAEDRLLCFGKLEEMRSMIPERRKRRPCKGIFQKSSSIQL